MRGHAPFAAVGSLAILFLFAAVGMAGPPSRSSFEVDATFPHSFLTARCGVPVFAHIEASGTTTLFYDQSGTAVIRELDTVAGGFRVTLFSLIEAGGTGNSLSFVQYGMITYTYPEGTDIGDPAIVTTVGPAGLAPPGGPSSVGREVADGEIVGFTPEGVPIVVSVAVVSQSGQFTDPAATVQARCDILAAP